MKVCFISDTHLTSPEIASKSLFPKRLDKMDPEKASALYERMRMGIEHAYRVCLAWIKEHGPWDLIVHLGDVTGGYGERGIAHPSVFPLAEEMMHDLSRVSPRVRVAWGNHETGYAGSLSQSGITRESVEACERIFGRPFWSETINGLTFVGIATPLACYKGSDAFLCDLKEMQFQFLADTMLPLYDGMPWILCLHTPLDTPFAVSDPDIARMVEGQLIGLERVVFGDLHNPLLGKMLCYLRSVIAPRHFPVRFALRSGALCPSTAPLWWKGYGLLTYENGIWNTINLSDAPHAPLPTSSFLRMTKWFLFG